MSKEDDPRTVVPLPPHYLRYMRQEHVMVTKPNDLPDMHTKLKKGEEFAFSPLYDPKLIDACYCNGYFPMSVNFGGIPVFAIKCHKSRMLVDLRGMGVPREESPQQQSGSVKKSAEPSGGGRFPRHRKVERDMMRRGWRVAVNRHWDEAVEMINKQHGDDWLCAPLRKAFRHMHFNPDDFVAKLVCVAIVCDASVEESASAEGQPPQPQESVVAVELGAFCGSVYTSLTGAFTDAGAGTAQLYAVNALIVGLHMDYWDFGMSMDYKVSWGGRNYNRLVWLDIARKASAAAVAAREKAGPGFTGTMLNVHPVERNATHPEGSSSRPPPASIRAAFADPGSSLDVITLLQVCGLMSVGSSTGGGPEGGIEVSSVGNLSVGSNPDEVHARKAAKAEEKKRKREGALQYMREHGLLQEHRGSRGGKRGGSVASTPSPSHAEEAA